MSHYAHISGGIVDNVIAVEPDVISGGAFGNPSEWIQTSYNTHGGNHPEGRPLRKNYAGIGYTYDAVRDAFIPPQPYPSWTLQEGSCLWEAPIPRPDDGAFYRWNEDSISWEKSNL